MQGQNSSDRKLPIILRIYFCSEQRTIAWKILFKMKDRRKWEREGKEEGNRKWKQNWKSTAHLPKIEPANLKQKRLIINHWGTGTGDISIDFVGNVLRSASKLSYQLPSPLSSILPLRSSCLSPRIVVASHQRLRVSFSDVDHKEVLSQQGHFKILVLNQENY